MPINWCSLHSRKTRWIFLQPVLVSMLLVIGVLLGCGLTYGEYRKSTEILSILLGPATVARTAGTEPAADSAIVLADLYYAGGGWGGGHRAVCPARLVVRCRTHDADDHGAQVGDFADRMLVAEQIGGVAALAAVFVLITGVIGAIFGPGLLRRLGVHSPEARGMALGMTAMRWVLRWPCRKARSAVRLPPWP